MPGNSIDNAAPEDIREELINAGANPCENSNRGMMWEEKFRPTKKNCYIRIRPTSSKHNRQIVRLHDLKLYGVACDTDGGSNPSIYGAGGSGVEQINGNGFELTIKGSQIILNEPATVFVYDLLGRLIENAPNVEKHTLNVSNGIYVVKAVSNTGKTISKKIIY